MAHVTYEEQFVNSNSTPNQLKYMAKCHPGFCKICFSKMYEVDTPGGGTELRTDLKDSDGESMFEPDGYGGASKVSVRPHIAQGTACGWGNTSSSVGANLWHSTTWGNKQSICQQDDTIDEAVETMFTRPGGEKDLGLHKDGSKRLSKDQLEALCDNPSMMGAKYFDPKPQNDLTPTIDESMPED